MGLQQTALQSCQNQIAGLEETIEQLVTAIKKLGKTICRCHDWLLSPGPHYAEGEEEEVVVDSEEEEDDEDSLEYETDAPSRASYTTPPSTGGCSEPSPHPLHSPTPEELDLENSVALQTAEIEAWIKTFLEEVEEDRAQQSSSTRECSSDPNSQSNHSWFCPLCREYWPMLCSSQESSLEDVPSLQRLHRTMLL